MNGRVQDPVLGRFISADPFVQAPFHTQSHNRYSYVWNNPASLIDPSGFCTLGRQDKLAHECTDEERRALECRMDPNCEDAPGHEVIVATGRPDGSTVHRPGMSYSDYQEWERSSGSDSNGLANSFVGQPSRGATANAEPELVTPPGSKVGEAWNDPALRRLIQEQASNLRHWHNGLRERAIIGVVIKKGKDGYEVATRTPNSDVPRGLDHDAPVCFGNCLREIRDASALVVSPPTNIRLGTIIAIGDRFQNTANSIGAPVFVFSTYDGSYAAYDPGAERPIIIP
jgi:hypothetical protein